MIDTSWSSFTYFYEYHLRQLTNDIKNYELLIVSNNRRSNTPGITIIQNLIRSLD